MVYQNFFLQNLGGFLFNLGSGVLCGSVAGLRFRAFLLDLHAKKLRGPNWGFGHTRLLDAAFQASSLCSPALAPSARVCSLARLLVWPNPAPSLLLARWPACAPVCARTCSLAAPIALAPARSCSLAAPLALAPARSCGRVCPHFFARRGRQRVAAQHLGARCASAALHLVARCLTTPAAALLDAMRPSCARLTALSGRLCALTRVATALRFLRYRASALSVAAPGATARTAPAAPPRTRLLVGQPHARTRSRVGSTPARTRLLVAPKLARMCSRAASPLARSCSHIASRIAHTCSYVPC